LVSEIYTWQEWQQWIQELLPLWIYKTTKIISAIGDAFIDEMTRYNKISINIDELSVLVCGSNFISRVEENQSAVPHRNIYPFSSLIDLAQIAITSAEIRTNNWCIKYIKLLPISKNRKNCILGKIHEKFLWIEASGKSTIKKQTKWKRNNIKDKKFGYCSLFR